jgi:type IV pilus assembly protein PilE
MKHSAQTGFTLIELMIVVVVVAVLARIAIPSYTAYLQSGKITEATVTLANWKVQLEQYYQDNRNFGSTASACGVANPMGTNFTYSCNRGTGGTDQTFTATATGNGSMANFVFTIDQSNAKTSSYPGSATFTCWIRRAGSSC